MFYQRTEEKGSDDGVKESGVLTVVRTKKREERKICGGRSINKVSTLTPSTLICAISIMISSDRPSEAELIHTVEIVRCSHARYPSHLQHRASSGQHGAYVKQGLPNHRAGSTCRRDLVSGNYPCSIPGAPLEHEARLRFWVSGSGAQELGFHLVSRFTRACHTKSVTNIQFSYPFRAITGGFLMQDG